MIRAVIGIALLALAQTAAAQTAPAATPAAAKPAAPQAKPEVVTPRGFDYDPDGRRDPFVSLLGRGVTERPQGPKGAGLGGLETADVALTGTMRTPVGTVAMLQGSDGKTYVARPGDRLRDGSIRMITSDALVIVQNVSDPLSNEREREVRKTIRQSDEAK